MENSRVEILEIEDGGDVGFFDKKNQKSYFFLGGNKQVTSKEQAGNKQGTSKEQAGNNQRTVKQQSNNKEVSIKLFSEIDKKMQQVATIKKKSKFAQLQIQLWIETSIAAKNEADKQTLHEINNDIQNYLNKADGASKGRRQLVGFDKMKHLQQNRVAASFLLNSKFIKIASEKKYKSFDDLTDYVPYSIVSAINEKKIHQTNGEPHTVKTLTYIADTLREKREKDKITKKRNRKIILISLFFMIVIVLFYVRIKTNQPLQLGATIKQQFEVGKNWTETEIAETVQLYATSQKVFIGEWRTGKILEVTENKQLTENELIFKIDSVVKFKYEK